MTNLLKILFLIFPLFVQATDDDIIKVRNLYYKASTSKKDAEVFFKSLESYTKDSNKYLLQGYKGMSLMIKANFDYNPYYKLSYFVKGKDLLEDAIKLDEENTELRFLRFGVQTNAPFFLGYNGKITEDKNVIIKNYTLLKDADLKARIKEYMLNSKSCSKEEKLIFK